MRQLLDSVTHMSAGQDYAAASAQGAAGTFGADAGTPPSGEARGRTSGANSPAGSRSGSRVRELLHKITHLSSGQDYAAQSAEASAGTFGQDAATAPSLNHGGAGDRVGRSPGNSRPASRSATPAGSRSQSRVREILHKATHMSSGQDYAASSAQAAAGTYGADALDGERTGRSPAGSRSASRSATPAGSRSQSRVREVLYKATHMSSGQDYAANSAQGAAGSFGADAPQGQQAHPEFK